MIRSPERMPALKPGVSSIGATTVTKLSFMRNHDSETAEMAFGVALQSSYLSGIQKFAVRIKLVNHPLERAVNEILVGELLPST